MNKKWKSCGLFDTAGLNVYYLVEDFLRRSTALISKCNEVNDLDHATYTVLATVMKYWFILLILFILYRAIRDVILEYKDVKRSKKDAYYVTLGYLEVIESIDHRLEGAIYNIHRDCYVGKGSFCDVRIKISYLAKTECFIYTRAGTVFIKNLGSKYGIYVDDVELTAEEDLPLRSGTIISLYGALLRVKLKEVVKVED